jgi:hypothetical protein
MIHRANESFVPKQQRKQHASVLLLSPVPSSMLSPWYLRLGSKFSTYLLIYPTSHNAQHQITGWLNEKLNKKSLKESRRGLFEIYSTHLTRGTKENHDKFQPVSRRQRLEPGTFTINARSVIASATLLSDAKFLTHIKRTYNICYIIRQLGTR